MKIETESIVKQAVGYIWDRFKQELKLVQLTKCVPIFNKNYVSKMADAGTGTAYMQHPPRRSIFAYNQLNEDQYPNNISMDEFANFQVKSKTDNIKGPIFKIKETQLASKQSTRTRFTGVTRRFSQKLSRGKDKQQDKQLLSKYFVLPPNTNNNLYELPATSPTQEEIDLEYQLRALQKKLYFTRKSKKQEEQKEQERIKELKKRKSPQKPTTDFTYQLDGNFMKRKPFTSNQLLAQHMKISQSFDLKPNDKKNIQQILAENEVGNRGRSQIGSRLQKTNLFNNSNKRQVSHLPFIKMCDNTKIREDNRNCQGNMTQRISLKSFSESMQEKSFRHYSQLEKQRKQKELIAKLEARRVQKINQELDKNPQEPQDDGYNNLIRRRQSYLMNRYLKKIRQQAPPETRKSLNFQRVGVSKNSAIHNYYKHNFNEERKYYESEVISRVLDNSTKQKQKQI